MPNRPLLLGHRGARSEKCVPENTIASFDLALAQGCDGFEFDVRLTADNEAVLCHDPKTRGLEIAKCSAQQLELPFLREVLVRYQRTAFLDIELKVPGLEKITANLLREITPRRGFVVSSFLPGVLDKMSSLDPGIPLGLICDNQSQFSLWPRLPVRYVILHHKLLRAKCVGEMRTGERETFVWTVNNSAAIQRFSRWGVAGIISDNPRLLARTLREKDGRPMSHARRRKRNA
ncbi:MAG: glycerophosphodiester phosphodiesterase [Candidatus Sulfotelmatobacter sp.]